METQTKPKRGKSADVVKDIQSIIKRIKDDGLPVQDVINDSRLTGKVKDIAVFISENLDNDKLTKQDLMKFSGYTQRTIDGCMQRIRMLISMCARDIYHDAYFNDPYSSQPTRF